MSDLLNVSNKGAISSNNFFNQSELFRRLKCRLYKYASKWLLRKATLISYDKYDIRWQLEEGSFAATRMKGRGSDWK